MKRQRSFVLTLALLLMALLMSGCKAGTSTAGGQPATPPAAASGGGSTTALAPGPTDCSTSNSTAFAKSKFVLHSGLAFGAFHRYIYKPLRSGQFQSGTHGRVTAFIKAGLAALFVKREVRLAYDAAKANPALCKLIAAPLRAIGAKLSTAVSALRSGDMSPLTGLEQSVQDVKNKAAASGTTIQEASNAPLQ